VKILLFASTSKVITYTEVDGGKRSNGVIDGVKLDTVAKVSSMTQKNPHNHNHWRDR